MRSLWGDIGFTPTTFELPTQDSNADAKDTSSSKHEGDIVIRDESNFRRQIDRPDMSDEDVQTIIGLQVRNFPPTLSDEDIVIFLAEHVDSDITLERVSLMKNDHSINAAVEAGLDGTKVIEATKEIEFRKSKKKFFGNPLYCRLLKNLTPEKTQPKESETNHPNISKNLAKDLDLKDKSLWSMVSPTPPQKGTIMRLEVQQAQRSRSHPRRQRLGTKVQRSNNG